MDIQPGEVFAIKTKIGFGFLQYVKPDQFGFQIVRVLENIKEVNELSQLEVDIPERFTVHFLIKVALTRKLIIRTGIYKIPKNYKIPTKARDKHIVKGEFLGWHIVDIKTLKRKFKHELTPNDLKLSPHGHPNDTLLIERLENNWRLENWK